MKQKIVIKVELHCNKCRTKALKVAATAYGVTSVALEGDDKNKVVVIGESVDAVALTSCLRKKVSYASLESVEELKPADKPAEGREEETNPVFYGHMPPWIEPHQLVVHHMTITNPTLQKIVINVELYCNKCRTKALKVAATAYGVTSVALDGDDKDKVVIIGEGVDAVVLTSYLRKKVSYASIESVEELKPDDQPSKERE